MKTLTPKLGILGGGQLAQMLALSAQSLGIEVHVLSAAPRDPAAMATSFWQQGDPNNLIAVESFLKKVDFLTFESEFVQKPILETLATQSRVQMFPSPKLMISLQDRLPQKELLSANGLPTSKFLAVHNEKEFSQACAQLGFPFVLKKRYGGYDGFGTFIVRDADFKFERIPQGYIAEKFVNFKRELAVIFVRSRDGSFVTLPLVQSQQVDHRCDWVIGPVAHLKLKPLVARAKKFLTRVNYVGVIAFELFDTGKDLLINEIAPRVHNSGHYSADALDKSQFDLHLLAGLGVHLNPVRVLDQFAMINLIGDSSKKFNLRAPLVGNLHWYNKSENKTGRKLGHLNYLGKNSKTLLSLGLKERKKIVVDINEK